MNIGEEVRVEDLIKGIIIQSGNDACIVAAENLAGSEDDFAVLMNKTAKTGDEQQFFYECNRAAGSESPDVG